MPESVNRVMEAISELRTEVEKKTADVGKIKKIEDALEAYETKNQELVKELETKKNQAAEFEEKLANFEKDLLRPRTGADKKELSEEVKSFDKLVKQGEKAMTVEEMKYLRTNSGQEGGFLVPIDYSKEIIKGITEISPLRSLARVRPTTGNEVHIPKRTTLLTGSWAAEGETVTATNSRYGLEKIVVHKMMVPVQITHEQLADAAFNMESEILADVQEEFARLEGAGFITGTNVGQPEGILTNASLSYTATGVDGALTADSIIEMAAQIKTGYNLIYLFNRKTRKDIRLLKDGNGQYIWQPGLGQGNPATLNGLPYVEVPDMPDVGSATYPIAIGDWRRSYTIVDNISMQMIRDPFSLATSGKVQFTFYKRVGGQVTLKEGIYKLKCSVS